MYRILYLEGSLTVVGAPSSDYKSVVTAVVEDLKLGISSRNTKPLIRAIFYSSLLRNHLEIPTSKILPTLVEALDLPSLEAHLPLYQLLFAELIEQDIQFTSLEDSTFSEGYQKLVEDFYICFDLSVEKSGVIL